MHYSLTPFLTAAASVCMLSACGAGGGNEATDQAALKPGDYFVYSEETTYPAPVTTPVKEYFTRTFVEANADGSTVREDTSTVYDSSRRTYSSEGLLTQKYRSTECTYAPAYTLRPPANTPEGETYTSTVTRTCVSQPATGAPVLVAPTTVVSQITVRGIAQGTEAYELPIGNFTTRKYTATATIITKTNTNTSESKYTEACWVDTASDKSVSCDYSNSTTPATGSTEASQRNSKSRLEGYVFSGAAPVGNTLPRFAGTWNITLGNDGVCNGVKVDASGKLSGTCTVSPTLTPDGITNAGITGTINAQDGSTTLVLGSFLLKLEGNFNSPKEATGTFRPLGQASKAWSAKRTL
jgi:hypothetical protein